MIHLKEHGCLIIDGLYVSGLLRATPSRPTTPLDYDRLARALLQQAGVSIEAGRYFVDHCLTLDAKFPNDPQMRERVRKHRGFHTALRDKKGFAVIAAPAPWRFNDCGARATDDRQVPGALMALLARLVMDRPDISHYVLLAASPAYIPLIELVRGRGVYVTLFYASACDELRHAVDCARGLRVAELLSL